MMLKKLELHGFKSFAKKTELVFDAPVASIVGPNGSGKSNVVEAIRFVLGEQSIKSLRSASGKDLIFAGSKQIPKMSRASVTITFDNKGRVFHLSNAKNETVSVDFDEVEVSREVFADGSNTYKINGNDVRMKDVVELIASVNIGSSGHHIISQGEADRLLNASAKDRKNMIEDALGLKLFQYRIKESEKKLQKTTDNLKETESLRREVAPHLKFLKRQVEKLERAQQLRVELADAYQGYLKRESILIANEKAEFQQKNNNLKQELSKIDTELVRKKKKLAIVEKRKEEEEIELEEKKINELRHVEADLSRQLGKLEGMIEIAKESVVLNNDSSVITVQLGEVRDLVRGIDQQIERILDNNDLHAIKQSLKTVRGTLQEFVASHEGETLPPPKDNAEKVQELEQAYVSAKQEIADVRSKIDVSQDAVTELRAALREATRDVQESERTYFELSNKRSEINSQKNMLEMQYQSTEKAEQDFNEELNEAKVLIGEDVLLYETTELEDGEKIDRQSQEQTRRSIERMKIKIEEIGGAGGSDVIKEYEETVERDQFLEREIADLEKSMQALNEVITDLQTQLASEFSEGVKNINEQFQNFFHAMFGGGKAQLKVVELAKRKRKLTDEEGNEIEVDDDDEDAETGIEIKVQLPRKKIGHLEMLSGGERSLTSIALLFALSQVNPPPFLVLDETDAALDEANSRRYGDMIESLSKLSQLIVVTHNRETMSRANILYGVTIGSEGCSKVLSVKFEDAEGFAK